MKIGKFEKYIYYQGDCVGAIRFMKIDSITDILEVHNEMYKWTPGIAKEAFKVWDTILLALKDAGIKKLVTETTMDKATRKTMKYWSLFGIQASEQEYMGKKIMYGELEL